MLGIKAPITQPQNKISKNPPGDFFGINMKNLCTKLQLSCFKTDGDVEMDDMPLPYMCTCSWQKSTIAKILNFSSCFTHGG